MHYHTYSILKIIYFKKIEIFNQMFSSYIVPATRNDIIVCWETKFFDENTVEKMEYARNCKKANIFSPSKYRKYMHSKPHQKNQRLN